MRTLNKIKRAMLLWVWETHVGDIPGRALADVLGVADVAVEVVPVVGGVVVPVVAVEVVPVVGGVGEAEVLVSSCTFSSASCFS